MSLYDNLGGNKNNLTMINGIKYQINGKIHLYIISILKHIRLFFNLFLMITDKWYKNTDKRFALFWCVDALFWCVFYVPHGTSQFLQQGKKWRELSIGTIIAIAGFMPKNNYIKPIDT